MTEYPRLKTYPYIGAVVIAAILLAVFSIWRFPYEYDVNRLGMLAALALLTSLAGRFEFRVSPQGYAIVSTAPIFLAVLLLHPIEAALVAVAGTVASEAWARAHPEALVFNSGAHGTAAVLAGLVFWSLKPDAGVLLSSGVVAAAIASGIVLHLANHSLLFGMITIVKGQNFWGRWWETWRFEAILDASLLVVGLLGAQLVAIEWWWLIVLFIPFVVTYYGFRRSVEVAVEKTELADQLERNLNELKETQSQLVQSAKLAGIGVLSAGLAHQINNPLTIVTGRAELLMAKMRRSPDSISTDQLMNEVQYIHDMGMRISLIMRQLLAYSRKPGDLTDVRLDAVIDDSVQLLQGKLDQKGMTLVKQFHRIFEVKGVANLLQQVFVNILDNAIDASPDFSKIVIDCSVRDSTAVVYIKDEGSGIPQEVRDQIFDPFFTTKSIGEGTGLGLFICHKIVEDHGGDIVIDSAAGEGTAFSISLPFSRVCEEQNTTAA